MGLFGALNIGKTGIMAQQKALETVGHNITNATTEGYSRQRVEMGALPASRFHPNQVGNGVSVMSIRRIFDQQVENRLQQAMSTLGSLSQQRNVYQQLETAVNALGDDPAAGVFVTVGGQVDRLLSELAFLASDPSSAANRAVFIGRADGLSSTVRSLAKDVMGLRESLNESVANSVRDVNQLTREIAQLNDSIVRGELGGTRQGSANDLRDRRDALVRRLSELTNISVNEQQTGAIDIRVGGEFLVTGNDWFALELNTVSDGGIGIANVEFALSGTAFKPTGGQLGGLMAARDDIVPGFLRDLDDMARTMIQTFNEVHTTGRGLSGLTSVSSNAFTAAHALNARLPMSIEGQVGQGSAFGSFLIDPGLRGMPGGTGDAEFLVGAKVLFTTGENAGKSATIAAYDPNNGRIDFNPPMSSEIRPGDRFEVTSLDYGIQNGSFKLNVRNDVTGITDVFDIQVDRNGLPGNGNTDDTSLQDLVSDINGQLAAFYQGNPPVRARITDDYRLVIESIEDDVSFHFTDDTSGFLAAAGINTFFTGHDALTMGVSQAIKDNPALFASGLSSSAGDNGNIQRMIALFNEKLFDGGTSTFQDFWRGVVGTLAVESATARELSVNQEMIATAAQNARERISGVNIDEEAIDLIRHQRSFQAASRYLGVVDQLLQELMGIV
jgi:flagellar hook-associated protein 1 FlgK